MNINIDSIVAGCLDGGKRRIVIPGFGALIRRPDGEIAFVDILNSDDGVLSEALSSGAGLTAEEAREAVGKYSFHLKTELLHKREVGIDGVGVIRMTPDGCYDMCPPESQVETNASVPEMKSDMSGNTVAVEIDVPVAVVPDEVAARESALAPEPVFDSEPESATEPAPIFMSESDLPAETVCESDVADEVAAREITTEEVAQDEITVPHSGVEEARNDFNIRSGKSERDLIKRLLYDDEPLPQVENGRKETSEGDEASPVNGMSGHSGTDADEDIPLHGGARERRQEAGQLPQVQIRRPKKKKVDGILIIGIIVLILAVAVVIYGEVVHKRIKVDRRELVITEEPAVREE